MPPGALPLLLVGAGKMGGAMLEQWLAGGVDGRQLTVLDPYLDEERRAGFRQAGVHVAAAPAEAVGPRFSTVILAVKPQSMDEALPQAAALATTDTQIVSIAAGVRLERIAAAFPPGQPIVRAMPNTPAAIGKGMTVAVASPDVAAGSRAAIDALLSAVGRIAWIDDEALIDAVTAVSGSGPAYVFLLAECLAEAGVEAGLPVELAELLGRQTVAGAGALLGESAVPPATLRQNVTSPGGTTEAALSVLMAEDGLRGLMVRAVQAAKRRATELG